MGYQDAQQPYPSFPALFFNEFYFWIIELFDVYMSTPFPNFKFFSNITCFIKKKQKKKQNPKNIFKKTNFRIRFIIVL